jgi:hypothetical protein
MPWQHQVPRGPLHRPPRPITSVRLRAHGPNRPARGQASGSSSTRPNAAAPHLLLLLPAGAAAAVGRTVQGPRQGRGFRRRIRPGRGRRHCQRVSVVSSPSGGAHPRRRRHPPRQANRAGARPGEPIPPDSDASLNLLSEEKRIRISVLCSL